MVSQRLTVELYGPIEWWREEAAIARVSAGDLFL